MVQRSMLQHELHKLQAVWTWSPSNFTNIKKGSSYNYNSDNRKLVVLEYNVKHADGYMATKDHMKLHLR